MRTALTPKAATAEKLLQHGALGGAEFRRITGWPRGTAHGALQQLVEAGRARRTGAGRSARYEVVA